MAFENETVLDWTARGVTGVLNIGDSPEPFDDTKEEYNLTITIANDAGQEQIFVYKVTNALEHLPALCVIGYQNINSLTPGCCYYFSTNALDQAIVSPHVRLLNITGNIDFELVSSEGTGNYSASRVLHGGANCIDIDGDIYTIPTNTSVSINIVADFPLFMGTETDYDDSPNFTAELFNYDASVQGTYISEIALAGDLSNIDQAVNGFSEENTIPKNKVYFIKNILKKNGSTVAHSHYRFRLPPDAKIWFVAPEHDNTGQTTNMVLHMSGLGLVPTFEIMNMEASTPSWQTAHALSPSTRNYYYGEWTDFSNGDWYKVVGPSWAGYTNIPVFKSELAGEWYRDGKIGEDAAENAGDLGYDGNITTGDGLDSNDIPTPTMATSGNGCDVWALSDTDMSTMMGILYSSNQTIIDDIEKGTWLWGNNPIDFIISIYYIPFSISSFYNTSSHNMYFGSYDTGQSFQRVIESKSDKIILVNTTIDQVYGDWRDIDFFKYDLFLPFVGFVPLDPVVYVGHTLKVEMAFDVMTHNLRYYLFCDGVVTDRIDGSVGYSIPITGTDQVNKANNNLNGLINTVKGGVEGTIGLATGNIGAMATGGMDMLGGIRQLRQYPREIIRGDISASMNIFDINYVYLKITEKQSIYPPEIREVYNNPSYVCCKLSELSGYCELQDVQLISSCTEVEYAEILQLLKEGVIF